MERTSPHSAALSQIATAVGPSLSSQARKPSKKSAIAEASPSGGLSVVPPNAIGAVNDAASMSGRASRPEITAARPVARRRKFASLGYHAYEVQDGQRADLGTFCPRKRSVCRRAASARALDRSAWVMFLLILLLV